MAKILIAFFNAIDDPANEHGMPCFYESFIHELNQLGCSLLVYHHSSWSDIAKKALPHDIKTEIADFQPDLAIVFNNNFYELSEDFDFPVVVYEVDSILYYQNKDVLRNKPNRFKYIVPQRESIEIIHQELKVDCKNICYLPFFTSVQRENLEKSCNISFIGSRFSVRTGEKNLWNEFMMTHPSADDVKGFRHLIEYIEKHPLASEESVREHVSKCLPGMLPWCQKNELLSGLSGVRRIQTLSAVAELGLCLYGTPSWISENCDDPLIPLSFNDKRIYSLRDNQDVYNQSKLSINVNHLQAVSGFSWRVCDIMASSSCLVSEYKSDLVRLFPKVPIPTFSNQYEAREQCCRLLKEDALREDIVCASNEAIEGNYRFNHLIPMLEDFLGIRLTSSIAPDKSQLTIRRLTSSPIGKICQETSGTSFRLRKILILLSSMLLFSRPERRMYRERKLAKLKRKYHIQ